MTTIVLLRHGLTPMTGPRLAGWTPGISPRRARHRRRPRKVAERLRSAAVGRDRLEPSGPLPGNGRRRGRRTRR